jgi:arginine utilization protein RocB
MGLSGKRVRDLTIELARIRSVVGTKGESAIAKRIHEILGNLEYFRNHKDCLSLVSTMEDNIRRSSVLAVVKGKKDSNRNTVVVIGHTDTVGVSDYGDLADFATNPEELAMKLQSLTLSEEARSDLESGAYLFGRGVLDMKSGVSILIAAIEELARDAENLSGNIVFAAVCDEEGNSKGMLSIVPELVMLQKENGFDYLCVVDTDYTAPRFQGDDGRYLYVGTVGKIMPSFYCVGKETHVGDPFGGLDANELASSLVEEINLNTKYSDEVEGEVSVPPITLKLGDFKPEYSVQTNRVSHVYFNFSTHVSTPDMVLEKLRKGSRDAFSRVVDKLNGQYAFYCEKTGFPHGTLPWKPRVMTFSELYALVLEEKGEELEGILSELTQRLMMDRSIEERVFASRIVQEVHRIWSDKDPVIILYFSPPYYPHIYVEGKTDKERKLLSTLEDVVASRKPDGYEIRTRKFYPYISDLSYVSLPRPEAVEKLRVNMPGYGTAYTLPLESMALLDLPVCNLGTFGKDAHQFTERVQEDYSFHVVPDIVLEAITALLKS